MRTGAIFARGSCRALKWMALVGMVFALGSAQAAAQADTPPAMTAASFEPGSATVTITMSEKVWGGGDAVSAANFTIDGASPANPGVEHTLPATESGAATEFTVTFTTAFDTGDTVTVSYTAPSTNVGGHIVDVDGTTANRLVTATQSATEQDIVPVLPALTTFNQVLDKDVVIEDPIELPQVNGEDEKGSNGTITYSISTLPAGLSFDPATREISGTPTMVTPGAMTITYVAADDDTNLTSQTPDTVTGTFTITVRDRPSTPAAPMVTATTNTSGSLDVTWTAPSDNNSTILYYVVEYREMGGTWVVVPENVRHPVGGGEIKTVVDGLTNGTRYEFHVQAVNGAKNNDGRSDWSPVGSGSPMLSGAAPAAPAAPTVTANAPGSLQVTWVAPNDNGSAILDYSVRWRAKGATDWTTRTGVTTLSTTLTGLSSGMTYEVQVQARNDNDVSPWSPIREGMTLAAPSTTIGEITGITVDGSVEKAVGGVKRQHVKEGVLTKATVTIRWSHAQIRELWASVAKGSKPPDVPVTLQMMPLASAESWLSEAEHEVGHDDVTLGTAAMVVVPKNERPVTATSVGYVEGTGSTSIHFGLDPDAEAEAFELMVTNAANFAAGGTTKSKVHVIEDIDPQNIVLKRDGSGVIYEGRSDVKFDVTADPRREDLPLDVRFDLKDLKGDTVESRDNYIDKSVGTIPIGTGPAAKDTVTLTLDDNDGNREDDNLALHAEVVVYALDTGAYDDIDDPDPVEITVVDVHKLPPLTVSPMTAEVAEGGETMLTYTVNRNPPDTIVLPGEVREYTNEPLTITLSANPSGAVRIADMMLDVPKHSGKASDGWEQTVTVDVEALADEELDHMQAVTLNATLTGDTAANGSGSRMDPAAVATITIDDETVKQVEPKTETQVADAVERAIAAGAGDEGLNPDESFSVAFSDLFTVATGYAADYDVSVSGSAVTATEGSGEVMIKAVDVGDSMVTVTAKASAAASATVSQTSADSAEVMFDVTVVNTKLVVTLMADPMEIEEDGSSMITASTNRNVHADDGEVKIDLTTAGGTASADDYNLEAMSITIPMGEMSASATLMAVDDHDVEGSETVTLQGAMGGMIVGTVMVTIKDNDVETTYSLEASATSVEEGGEVTITAKASQAVVENIEVMLMRDGASTAGDDDYEFGVTAGVITILTGETEGKAILTATDDMEVEGDESLMLNGMVADMSAGSVMVTIEDNDMESEFTLSGPEDMNVAEGMSATITVTANQAVAMDTEIMVMRDRAMSSASDDDYSLDPMMITIEAGEMTGSTMVMAVEDNMMEEMEELVLYAMAGETRIDGEVKLYLWDAAVPALPVIAQLLLAALMAVGGYRRYRRR